MTAGYADVSKEGYYLAMTYSKTTPFEGLSPYYKGHSTQIPNITEVCKWSLTHN